MPALTLKTTTMALPRREFRQLALLAIGSDLLFGRTWAAEAGPAAGGSAPKKVPIIGAGLLEMGAARIPDNHELTLRYVREVGLPVVPPA